MNCLKQLYKVVSYIFGLDSPKKVSCCMCQSEFFSDIKNSPRYFCSEGCCMNYVAADKSEVK